ncbi:MAG: DUF5060 domain-containing protein [Prolixibacteraceae bacterium]|jgi:hypothetical protein|nr:DUF5060 domain-containing protein [Prolixibacteraceae bacterium]
MKTLKNTFFIWLLIVHGISGCNSEKSFISCEALTKEIKQYEKAEFQINLKEKFANPYDAREIALNMILTNPLGGRVFLPCYYESGDSLSSTWKARFSPQHIGQYKYHFELLKNGAKKSKFADGSFRADSSDKDGFLHINDFWTLKFDSGKPFRGIGENVGWESRSYQDPKWNYDYLLPTLSQNGANFFRCWMAPNNFPLEWKKVKDTKRYSDTDEYFNPGGVKRLDEVIELIDSLNLYVMIAFDSHNTLIEGNQWEIHNYNKKNGGPANNPTEFFTLKESREKYKNRLRYIVARWGYSTNIAAWEFFNEIDNAAFTRGDSIRIPHKAITDWHKEMAAYLKEIDPFGHIVTTSVSHREIEGLYALDEMDLNQMHIYKRTKQIPAEIIMYNQTYNKPFSWGEFGYEWDWNKDFSKIVEEFDHDYKIGLWYGLFNPTPILPMTWWWEFFDERGMTPYFNSVAEINEQMLKAGNGSFEQIKADAGNVETYAVKCGETLFAYLLNDSGKAEKVSAQLEVADSSVKYKVKAFHPETREYTDWGDVLIEDNRIVIPGILLNNHKDIILILSATAK